MPQKPCNNKLRIAEIAGYGRNYVLKDVRCHAPAPLRVT
jgi:hypothetical protein